MSKSTVKHKATKINLPRPSSLKVPATVPLVPEISSQKICFSFLFFDRTHKLFNLGGENDDGTIEGQWFLQLLDCLKNASDKTIQELKQRPFCLHPIKWETANAKCPFYPQAEWFQFRINKSRGRVIGMLISGIFYVVWLDPHHNLTDSEGYGGAKTFPAPRK